MFADFSNFTFCGNYKAACRMVTKLSLWSFRVIKDCCFAIRFVRLSMLSTLATYFACESLMLVVSVLAFLEVAVMLFLRSLSCLVLSSL